MRRRKKKRKGTFEREGEVGRRKKNRERCVRGRSGAAYKLDRLAAACLKIRPAAVKYAAHHDER